MNNPAMPGLPGFGTIAETMELVRNMWGGMSAPGVGIPGMVMPTLSVEEINKQISDLKAVESWLTLNMNMLRGTIQALEVQSATISTLRSMGETFNAAVKPVEPAAAPSQGFSFPFGSVPSTEARKSPAASPFAAPASATAAPEPAPAAADAPTAQAVAPAVTDATVPLANPAAWWSLLQDQFKQAVSTALTPEAGSTVTAGSKSASDSTAARAGGAAVKGDDEATPKKAARSPARPATKSGVKSASKTAAKTPARPR
ncbi:MAG: hypothetical protein H7234_09035 [Herminiimonas sp.]|nr:hypothetical protein [Herminiimonas sp.]